MKSTAFDYLAPKTIDEAIVALESNDGTASVIAGGQSLVPMLNLRVAAPAILIDIGGLAELKGAKSSGSTQYIGALTTHAEIEDGKLEDDFRGLVPKVASEISYRAVRNFGTIGGSVALADPAADWPVCLIALDAIVVVAGAREERKEAVNDFIKGQYATSLKVDELVIGFEIARSSDRLRWGRCKIARKSGAFANSIVVAVDRGNGGSVRIVLGAAAARPFLLTATAEAVGQGAAPDMLHDAVAQDLAGAVPDLDAYQKRLHTAAVLRSIAEMQN